MKPIVLVKIGGSLITDKTTAFSLKEEALKLVCREIKKASRMGKWLIIGHGAGSFAHFPAKKYGTAKGIINKESYAGLCEVADVACRLNRIVVKRMIDYGVNALSISPISFITSDKHQLKTICLEGLEEALRLNLLPVVYGDVILDTKVGCTVFSAEKVLGYIGLELKRKGYKIEKIIHCGQTNGVYDVSGKTIPQITNKNFERFSQTIGGSGGVDVTGGMIHKVKETLNLAKEGIPGLIIDGIEKGSLSKAISGKKVEGTEVAWES